jgi:beta-mannosidase
VLNSRDEAIDGVLFLHTAEAADMGQFGAELPISIPPGISRHEVTFEIVHPRLWWPVGQGEPYLYGVVAALIFDNENGQAFSRRVGIRKVEVDQSPHPVEGKHFILKINDRPIFCKGGNWVPPDMLYSTVTPERYRELVDLALGANFNLLRVWGGGVFADRALLDYCDEKGVLVWHDLLFACSKYPGDHPEFAAEVRREVRWAMREMAHHPSLVVWCGNNEIEEGDWHWGYDSAYRTHPHYALFHHDLPQIAAQEDPSKFYWISSPYSPDYKSPRDPTVGDQHPWKVSLQVPGGADWWEYRTFVDRFPNEGGVLGASSPATLRQFLPENERYLLSPSWEHHDNPFAINDTQPGRLGHAYQTVQLWTGRDPLEMDWEQYVFVSALLQAEGITEYITNYRRRMFSSAAAVFWMYNDSWPVTHGWTIVDYYRRKKLAYHPVRRAFAPVAVAVTLEGRYLAVYGMNDTPQDWRGRSVFAWATLNGQQSDGMERDEVVIRANSVELLEHLDAPSFDPANWLLGARLLDPQGQLVAQHRLFLRRFGELQLVREPQIDMSLAGGNLTLRSDVFCWGVCLDVDGELPLADNCFDLLPGVPYTLPWDMSVLGEPHIVRLGNRDAV